MNRNLKHIFFIVMTVLMVGAAKAQTDPQYVIKKGTHYLAHVGTGTSAIVTNVDIFDPNTCLWYSGPNIRNNYYFMDGNTRRYLSAPLTTGGALSFSSTQPGTGTLNMTSGNYYFYAWDHGVARGIEHSLADCQGQNPVVVNGFSSDGSQCWEAVWVAYEGNTWKMSSHQSYVILRDVAAIYHNVTIAHHNEEFTPLESNPGGIVSVTDDFSLAYSSNPLANQQLNIEVEPYSYSFTPEYTCYTFEAVSVHETPYNGEPFDIIIPEESHYFDADNHSLQSVPTSTSHENMSATGYSWTITGEGAAYLSFNDSTTNPVLESSDAEPTVYYIVENQTNSHKQATLTLTVTYAGGATQTRTVTVTVKTQCKNPEQASAPVVTYENVTVSWHPTADSYTVSWKKNQEGEVGEWTEPVTVGNVTSFPITGLEDDKDYLYRVKATCASDSDLLPEYPFHTKPQAKAVIYGSVFGGGRMADVSGTTEVVIINTDSISAVYGGNDIAGTVHGTVNNEEGAGGSTIVLGIDASDASNSNSHLYNGNAASTKVRIGDVYGGGNGYYAYDNPYIIQADYLTTYNVPNGASINAITPEHPEGEAVWTNGTGTSQNFAPPTISKSNITVTNDCVKIDSLFGGAKNAILRNQTNDVNITINGGTIFTVFGGNNFGGSLGYQSKENIIVNNTTVKTTVSEYQAPTQQLGRDFGIGYLFGGGNKVYGQNVEITVNGGQMDTIFGGGNSADVRSTILTVNCGFEAADSGNQFGNVYSNAINSCTGVSPDFTLDIKDEDGENGYKWEGNGIYNVRTLFGGNNKASMAGVPTLNLTSGSIGTVYGGGNAGDMKADATDNGSGSALVIHDNNVKYGTHVKMNSPYILIDYLYGGCQMSNVYYSTWVEIMDGHVGTVYGGCNISGDVGSTRTEVSMAANSNNSDGNYQKVFGAPYVVASGGTVYKDLFAGSNGLYHCISIDHIYYVEGVQYDPNHSYVGMTVPTHNETYVTVTGNVHVKHNVYAGGNLAAVGFEEEYGDFPRLVGFASVNMSGGTVDGNVFGGGNMASIYGSNEVRVSGGSIGERLGGALYGGNDRLGKAGATTNRKLPDSYGLASDGCTSLTDQDPTKKVKTYVGVTGNPTIHTVYGGGNGDYRYTNDELPNNQGYCDATNKPIQTNIFVDIAIDGNGSSNGAGYITNVYGGGNGVYADGFIKVFLNVQNEGANDGNHVGTIYGGNNKGDLTIVPEIILLRGNVGTVYGGCNSGAMAATGDKTKSFTINGTVYDKIGSYVHLRKTYPGLVNNVLTDIIPTAKVTGAAYGGCRMNGVTENSLVFVESGNHSTASFFGGSDISGDITGTSYVVVNGSCTNNVYDGIVGDAYGGGNGNYYYSNNNVYPLDDHDNPIATGTETKPITPPYCPDSRVIMLDGKATNLYAGGYAGDCGVTTMQVEGGLVTGSVFGGGNMAGSTKSHLLTTTTVNNEHESTANTITSNTSGNSTVTMNGGSVIEGIYGGCNSSGDIAGTVVVNINGGTLGTNGAPMTKGIFGGGFGANTTTSSDVTVNISSATATACPEIYGSIYGGSALGKVNHELDPDDPDDQPDQTTVNFLNGTLHGNVYGGGLGAATLNSNGYINTEQPITKAYVNGTVHVNIGSPESASHDNYSKYVNIDGKVFGGNNLAGTPLGNVYVDVYRTAHNSDNICPSSWTLPLDNDYFETATRYALSEVYGGGNLAHYEPTVNNATTEVHVHACENTVQYVYGGGNAADVPTCKVTIDGGLVGYVFGGGNGAGTGNPGANVSGNNTIAIDGGVTGFVFGGSNTVGYVTGVTDLQFAEEPNCNVRSVNELYGGGNQAADANGITLNVPCGITGVKTIYGGSKNAHVGTEAAPANIVLNVRGGDENLDAVFGGNNQGGTIWGNVTVNLYGGTINEVYGGNNAGGDINGTIQVNLVDQNLPCPLHVNTIYGGGNEAAYTHSTDPSPEVNIIHGTVNKAVFGGGKGSGAAVTANPKVVIGDNVTGHTALVGAYLNGSTTDLGDGNVFGGGDQAAVRGNTLVSIVSGKVEGNVFGGGNEAQIGGDTEVRITGGEIVHKVVGGGNNLGVTGNVINAGVTGDVVLNISGGAVCTATDGLAGVYGGCNESGIVNGNITLNITGTNSSQTTIGTLAALEAGKPVNVHGGGYGSNTGTKGNVTINYGTDAGGESSVHCDYPMLYGDMYGGSALGNINDDASDITTLNILNGSVKLIGSGDTQVGGNIYGGGLGDNTHAAIVNGRVFVHVGNEDNNGDLIGKASLIGCNVYGCNNKKGSPQQNVFVDVYQTNHITTDLVDYEAGDATFAIGRVYGGGNQADYHPNENSGWEKKVHNTIHTCDNTIFTVYGGGRAAATDGVVINVEGGRFEYVFGGGNGQSAPANILNGGIYYTVCSGHVGWQYAGCDMGGTVAVSPVVTVCDENNTQCGELTINNYFFGDNMAPHYGTLYDTIYCNGDNPMEYKSVYGGSRLANIYGDIVLVVKGGTITNLFGGSQGSEARPGNIKKFPATIPPQSEWPDPDEGPVESELYHLYEFMSQPENSGVAGTGGNIYVKLEGGNLTNVYGGCELVGNVEGDIVILVDEDPNECGLNIDYIYGGNMQAEYRPDGDTPDPTRVSPRVYLVNGKVNYDVFGGSAGAFNSPDTKGKVISNPKVIIGDMSSTGIAQVGNEEGDGNVYGGGSFGAVVGDAKVILQGKTTIGNNVYGGAKQSTMTGNANVVVTPKTHTLTVTAPEGGGGTIIVNDSHGQVLINGSGSATVPEDIDLQIVARPDAATSAGGYVFGSWTFTGTGATMHGSESVTSLTIGTSDVTLTASFTPMSAHQLTVNVDNSAGGTGTVKVNGTLYTAPIWLVDGTSVSVVATPAPATSTTGNAFQGWTLSGGGTLSNPTSSTTIFTMGTGSQASNAVLTASFGTVDAYELSLNVAQGVGSFTINGIPYTGPVWVASNASVTVRAIPDQGQGYIFSGWQVAGNGANVSNATASTTVFTMGTGDATMTANFVRARRLTITQPQEGGTIRVTNSQNNTLHNGALIREGTQLNLIATHDEGYSFGGWTVTGATPANASSPTTTFTMGSSDVTVTATFTESPAP